MVRGRAGLVILALAFTLPGVLGGARAMATVALVAPGAEDALDRVRAVLDADGVEAAASGWDGKCVVRALAHDGFPLRRLVAQVLMTLRPGPLPRVSFPRRKTTPRSYS